MTLEEIMDAVSDIEAMVSDKGWTSPRVEYNYDGRHWFHIRANHPIQGGDSIFEMLGGEDTPDYALREAKAFVRSMQSDEDAALDDFRKALGKLIDKGNKLGIESSFLNPLTEQMRRLSENILTSN